MVSEGRCLRYQDPLHMGSIGGDDHDQGVMQSRRHGRLTGGGNGSLGLRGTPSPTSAPELSFGIHQPGLNPSAEGPIVANGLAVEQLCQCSFDSLVDVAELGFLDGHFGDLSQTRDPLDAGDRGAAEGVARHDVRG